MSAGSFEGRQSKRPAPSAWKQRYDLKSFFVQRKPQECIAENNGEQFSMKEEQVTWGPLGAISLFRHLPCTMGQSTRSRVWCSTGAKAKLNGVFLGAQRDIPHIVRTPGIICAGCTSAIKPKAETQSARLATGKP
ncbi:TPA: hypothetical protein ACH3X1_007182 [Trebouxia sp. C0004]